MRHSGYRHFNPPEHTADGHEMSSTSVYIHAFLLLCWFLASMHWAWVWYTKREDARREQGEQQYCLPLYEIQRRDGRREDCGDQVGLLLWLDDISNSENAGKLYLCAEWLTGGYLVVGFHQDKEGCGIAYAHSIPITCHEQERMLLVQPRMCRCEGD